MYYSFPNEYFIKVETRSDFEYNFIGKVIEWNDRKNNIPNNQGNFKVTNWESIIAQEQDKNKDANTILGEADEEYASEEAGK
ncbi:MAG: hypothetical protein ACRC2K_12020 [Clostridium sp.]